jgi:DNA-packaging protein gp3
MKPLKFKTVKELQNKIDAYFESCYEEIWKKDAEGVWQPVTDKDGNILKSMVKPMTVTGLALALGTTRETLLDYEDREEYSDTIKRAKLMCENFAEEQLFTSKNTAGVIFNLKNNYKRWVDKQEVDQKTEQTFSIKLPGDLSGD